MLACNAFELALPLIYVNLAHLQTARNLDSFSFSSSLHAARALPLGTKRGGCLMTGLPELNYLESRGGTGLWPAKPRTLGDTRFSWVFSINNLYSWWWYPQKAVYACW